MFKYAGLILDQSDDTNKTIVKISESVPIGIIKTASQSPKKIYALKILTPEGKTHLKYPLDTPYDAYVSALYFEKTARFLPTNIIPQVAARIKKALEIHNIDPERFQFICKTASENVPDEPVLLITKVAKDEPTPNDKLNELYKLARKLTYQARKRLPDDVFALVIEKGGKKIRKYPLHDEAHVRNAIARFAAFHNKLPPKYRAVVARKIKQKAKQYGIEISEDNVINKYAGEELSPYFWQAIQIRQEKTKHNSYAVLEKIAKIVDPLTLAEKLEEIDHFTGFDKHWDAYGDPYETVFGKYKTASERLTKQDDVKKMKHKIYTKAFGKEIADLMIENEEVEKTILNSVDISLPNI